MGSFAPMIRCVPIRRGAPRANCRLRLHSVNLDGMPAREDILANLFEGVGLIPFRNAGILGRLAAKYLLHLPRRVCRYFWSSRKRYSALFYQAIRKAGFWICVCLGE